MSATKLMSGVFKFVADVPYDDLFSACEPLQSQTRVRSISVRTSDRRKLGIALEVEYPEGEGEFEKVLGEFETYFRTLFQDKYVGYDVSAWTHHLKTRVRDDRVSRLVKRFWYWMWSGDESVLLRRGTFFIIAAALLIAMPTFWSCIQTTMFETPRDQLIMVRLWGNPIFVSFEILMLPFTISGCIMWAISEMRRKQNNW